jgi:hypothetical protein
MTASVMGRRAFLLAILSALGACAAPEPPAPIAIATADPDPDPEQVYSPGAISWAELTDEHKRRARAALTRVGESVPDDDALQARWMTMSPAQQRFMIRRPPPPPPRPVSRSSRGSRQRGRTQQHRTTPQRRTSTQTQQRRRRTNP